MSNKNKLSIYLIKEEYTQKDEIFDKPEEINIFPIQEKNATIYYEATHIHEPSWVKSFFHINEKNNFFQANSRVVFIKQLEIEKRVRLFALTFGYARFMFKPNVLEEQFGLKIVLNSIKQNEIRKISKTSVGTNQKQSEEQLPKSSDISNLALISIEI